MSDAQDLSTEPPASVRLLVEHPVRVDLDVAERLMREPAWLGRLTAEPAAFTPGRRIATDLELPILDGSASGPVRKAAFIDLGPPRAADGAVEVTVAWQSATAAPLFPLFSGELRITPDRLVLDGGYVPPFGRVGLVIDAALLRFVARRSAQAFLARVAARLAE